MYFSPIQKRIMIASAGITMGLGIAGIISGENSNSPEKLSDSPVLEVHFGIVGICKEPFKDIVPSEAQKVGEICLYNAQVAK